MKKFTVDCDMGSVKIFNEDLSLFFDNGIGDFPTKVTIYESSPLKNKYPNGKFLGHFTVKTKAWLSDYDCTDNAIYEFNKGRYFVYQTKNNNLIIQYTDNYLNS